MILLKRIISTTIILILTNIVILVNALKFAPTINVITIVFLVAYFVKYNIFTILQNSAWSKIFNRKR